MNKKRGKQTRTPDIEEIAEQAEQGNDVSEYFTGQHLAKQRVNIDFPLKLLRAVDAECRRIGITRQAWIKMACDEKHHRVPAPGISFDQPNLPTLIEEIERDL